MFEAELYPCSLLQKGKVVCMNVFEAVQTRRSIRKYQDRAVEQEKLAKILEAARLSPSACNKQPWHFIVVSEKVARQSLLPAYRNEWFVNAPVIIAACVSPDEAWVRWDGEAFWHMDSAIAVQDMILVARELGLGTCWVGAFDEKKVKEALGIPADIKVVALFPLGYPAEAKGVVTERKPLEEIVHYEHW
jgi:nitroreductase